ncbi:bifunctional ADP-dependent NAD(P)H-hydrate dehydratase/NAD(P)H-hydrate epimerase [Derxia gummosa]|uniref:Bifunctional NAD(P)H-hydrate repair enzyme n=1 Tax=Derxia gummosa DSM 723 TaxID=1121388 RepID=A0A8B6X3I1_9BURK|nr:bifunctional ADP-dependent NAD(P)H-hydrate dehydratase/NAD(P)H-hydrate epimerase [Derxia gummosa]
MTPLLTLAQLRAVETAAQAALPARTLMSRAGAAIADAALALDADDFLLLAGPGNNGGDAFEAAARLHRAGRRATVLAFGDLGRLTPDSAGAVALCRAAGLPIRPAADLVGLLRPDRRQCVIDGLFGIGLQRAPGGEYRAAIERVNAHPGPVLAIDLPSGIDGDSGAVVGGADGIAVRATLTVTMIGDKPGLHTGAGLVHAGRVTVAPIGLDTEAAAAASAWLNAPDGFAALLAPRALDSHKGNSGDLRIIGGSAGMTGAAVLAARAGLLAGAGRVFAHTLADAPAYDPIHPEIMWRPVPAEGGSPGLKAGGEAAGPASVIAPPASGALVIGPGLGQSAEARDLLAALLPVADRLVLDADALNLVAATPALQAALAARAGTGLRPAVLTPHPLEAARLLAATRASDGAARAAPPPDAGLVNADRPAVAAELARHYASVVALKGAGTVVAAPDGRLRINPTGNPALATGGTGDVLAGLAGALLARDDDAFEVACAAVWLHGRAADELVAAGIGPVGLAAGELAPAIRTLLNRLTRPA